MSRKRVQQECQARVSCQDCPVKSVQQKCQARVSSKSVKQERRKSVWQECPAKSVLPRVLLLDDSAGHLHKEKTSVFISALVSVHSALHKVTACGFVGSIRFLSFGNGFEEWGLERRQVLKTEESKKNQRLGGGLKKTSKPVKHEIDFFEVLGMDLRSGAWNVVKF